MTGPGRPPATTGVLRIVPPALTTWSDRSGVTWRPGRAGSQELRADLVGPDDEPGRLDLSLREWREGERTAAHHHDEDLLLQVLTGRLHVIAEDGGGEHVLAAGHSVHVPAGLRHHEEALETCRFLVVAVTPSTYHEAR